MLVHDSVESQLYTNEWIFYSTVRSYLVQAGPTPLIFIVDRSKTSYTLLLLFAQPVQYTLAKRSSILSVNFRTK